MQEPSDDRDQPLAPALPDRADTTVRHAAAAPGRAQVVGNRVAAAITGAFAALMAYTSWRYGLSDSGRPGAGLFPFLISLPLLLLTILWFIGAGRPVPEGPAGGPVDLAGADDADAPTERAGTVRVVLTLALTALMIVLFQPLGYVLSIALYLWGLLVVVARRHVLVSLAASVAGAIATKYLFDWIGLPLPPFPVPLPWGGF